MGQNGDGRLEVMEQAATNNLKRGISLQLADQNWSKPRKKLLFLMV